MCNRKTDTQDRKLEVQMAAFLSFRPDLSHIEGDTPNDPIPKSSQHSHCFSALAVTLPPPEMHADPGSSSVFPAISLSFTILGEIFAYVTVF